MPKVQVQALLKGIDLAASGYLVIQAEEPKVVRLDVGKLTPSVFCGLQKLACLQHINPVGYYIQVNL